MRRAGAAAALLVAVLLTACSDDKTATELHGQVVDPPFTVNGLELEDTGGAPYSLTDSTERRLTMVFFGYTHCPDICGLVLGNLASAMAQLDDDDREQVSVVFVTTDPARDDAQTLRRYLDHYDPQFIGLTGEVPDIEKVAASVGVGMGEKLATGGYDVDAHTTTVTAIDVGDVAPVYWHQTTSPAEYVADIHALLEED
jgi:protein SCO1/2